MIQCQPSHLLHGSRNNSVVEPVLPGWEDPSQLQPRRLDCNIYPEFIPWGAGQLSRSWNMWALNLLQASCMMLDTPQPHCCVCCAACNWLQGKVEFAAKALLLRAVSLRTPYPDLRLQSCFAPKQAWSAPGCLNLLQSCLNWKIPLFLSRMCCKTVTFVKWRTRRARTPSAPRRQWVMIS